MVGSRNEAAAEGVHFCQRTDLSCVTEVIGEFTSCQARAGSRLHSDEAVVGFASELFAHEGGDQTAEVGTAAGASDDHVGLDAELVKGRLCFQTDDGLMQKHLIEHAAEHIAVAFLLGGGFDGFGDGAAEASGGAGEFSENLLADFCFHRGRRRDRRSVGSHDFAAEGLLLIGNLHHVDLAVQTEEGTRHRKSGTPLTCACFGGDAFQTLLLGVIGLRHGGIELVAAAGVVAFKFVVDLGRRAERFLEEVCPDQRRRTEHFVAVPDLLGNFNVGGVVVQFLLD